MKKYIIIISSMILFLINSCTKDQTTAAVTVDCTNVSSKYSTDISPIINSSKCSNSRCHPNNGTIATYNQLMVHVNDGHFESYVINRSGKPMPPSGEPQLTTDEIKKINCWKQNGYLNN